MPDVMILDIEARLNDLADLRAKKDLLDIQKKDLIDSVIPTEVKIKLREIDDEFADAYSALATALQEVESEIKHAVIEQGHSFTGNALQAVYMPGPVTWESKVLEGMAKLIPQINEARKEGEPFVQIRKNGKK